MAFQVGNEVKYTELGQIAGFNYETAERYVEILEKTFVIFRFGALNHNLRNELKKSRKIYFYDNGIMSGIFPFFSFLLDKCRADDIIGCFFDNYGIIFNKRE